VLGDLSQLAREAVTTAGYPGIVAAMVAENLFPPIPSEVVLPLAGYETSRGNLDFVWTVAAATAGSLIGALILYAIGRFGGRTAVLRWGHVLRVQPSDLERAERRFERWGDWLVLGARVVPLARSAVSIPAGMMRMPVLRFCLLTTAGSLAWNLVLVGAGFELGRRWEEVSGVVGGYSDAIVLVAAIALLASSVLLWRRLRSKA
jgi:membrane protein DedA with SNARE-associated domain